MIRAMRLFSRSRVRMLAVGGGGGGRHGSTVVNLNNRRWSSSSSSVPPLSSESMKETCNVMNSSTTTDDAIDKAIDFVMEVNHVFQNEPEKYAEFHMLLFNFRADTIDLSVVKDGMMELLKGHNNLIWRFNNLLPPGEIPIPYDDDGLPFKYDSAAFKDY
ncbi:paired amphipathic helix protein Sin3 [Trifolium repens]|nr:paired amphipathic helix protein Sin3 [Trifolium repens]